jgi:hypothetical protein
LLVKINKIIKLHQPDMVIAERTTSYGFLATLSSVKLAIAQQGRTDLWPESSVLLPIKNNPKLCIQKCNTDPRVGTSNDHFYGQSQCRHGQSTRAAERD